MTPDRARVPPGRAPASLRSRGERAAWTVAGVACCLALVAVAHRVLVSPAGIVILQDARAPWIMPEAPVTAAVQQWRREAAPTVRFSTEFDLTAPPPGAALRLRAFGEARVALNGRPVSFAATPAQRAARWKRFARADVAALLRPGRNTLRVEISNRRGPALLSLRLEAGAVVVASGPGWLAAREGEPPRPALLASDARRLPDSYASERPLASLLAARNVLAPLLLLPALGFLLARRRLAPGPPRWLPAAAGGTVLLAWLALYALELRHLGPDVGFDAFDHRFYVEWLQRERRVPLAGEHWAAYHPPFFYALCAGLDALARALGAARGQALGLVPFLAGLGNVALAAALTARLLPGDRVARTCAVLFAGLLPVNLYVAAYFSNEGLHAFLSGLGLVGAVALLLGGEVGVGAAACLSLVLGAALLTKFTALVVAGPVLLAVGAKILVSEWRRPARIASRLAALALPLLAVAGWFYVRNVLVYGRPLVGNWDLPDPGLAWWSPPGFHTPGYYLRFGESLVRPYFSGFTSFWDALYSTLWGDGFLGGRAGVGWRHPSWNYGLMAAGYELALPATLLLAAGFVGAVRSAWRDPEPRRRAAFALLVGACAALGFAAFWLTLALPYHGQARASYLLALTPVWALCFARATSALDGALALRGWTPARALLVAWLGALFGVFYLGFAG